MVTFRDVDHFSNEGRLGKAVEYLPDDVRAGFGPFEAHYRTRGLLHSDPPVHTRLRTLVRDPFSPRAVERLRPRVQAIVDDLLDRVRPAGTMDIVTDLAVPLPATVIAEIFGVPAEDAHRIIGWSDDVLAFQGQNRPERRVATTRPGRHRRVACLPGRLDRCSADRAQWTTS